MIAFSKKRLLGTRKFKGFFLHHLPNLLPILRLLTFSYCTSFWHILIFFTITYRIPIKHTYQDLPRKVGIPLFNIGTKSTANMIFHLNCTSSSTKIFMAKISYSLIKRIEYLSRIVNTFHMIWILFVLIDLSL